MIVVHRNLEFTLLFLNKLIRKEDLGILRLYKNLKEVH